MMLEAVKGGLSYLRSNPTFLVAAARQLTHLTLPVPLDALRWLIARRPQGKGPERIEIDAAPPALGVGLTVDLYGTKLDVSAHIHIDSIEATGEALRIALRVKELALKAPQGTPAAMMVQSLDLSRPANLMNMMPQKHKILVEAEGDRFVLDLFQIKALGGNETLRRVLGALSEAFSIREVRTDDSGVLLVGLGINPLALPQAVLRLRAGA